MSKCGSVIDTKGICIPGWQCLAETAEPELHWYQEVSIKQHTDNKPEVQAKQQRSVGP